MMVLRCSSSAKDMQHVVKAASSLGEVLLLSPSAVRTRKELQFAFYLAKEAFAQGENIASSPAKEALLFLSCETNFSSAVRKVGAASVDDFVLVSESKLASSKLKKALLLTRAQALKLSEWGRKKGNYFEGELAVEKMALSRIRN